MKILLHVIARLLLSSGALIFIGAPVFAQSSGNTLTDRLIAELLQKHAPSPLYQQGNNPWPGGDYKLEVFKNGKPRVDSSASRIHLQIPLKIALTGSATSGLLNLQLDCTANFTTMGEVTLTPRSAGSVTDLQSELTLPVPPVSADCGGVQVPVDGSIKALVAQNKKEWEKRIDKEVSAWLAQ